MDSNEQSATKLIDAESSSIFDLCRLRNQYQAYQKQTQYRPKQSFVCHHETKTFGVNFNLYMHFVEG